MMPRIPAVAMALLLLTAPALAQDNSLAIGPPLDATGLWGNQASDPITLWQDPPSQPMPMDRNNAAWSANRIQAILDGIAPVDTNPTPASDCPTWAKIARPSPQTASVLLEATCLANTNVLLALGANPPEQVHLDAYGAVQRVVAVTGSTYPLVLRRPQDGALLMRQDDPDLPPTAYDPAAN